MQFCNILFKIKKKKVDIPNKSNGNGNVLCFCLSVYLNFSQSSWSIPEIRENSCQLLVELVVGIHRFTGKIVSDYAVQTFMDK